MMSMSDYQSQDVQTNTAAVVPPGLPQMNEFLRRAEAAESLALRVGDDLNATKVQLSAKDETISLLSSKVEKMEHDLSKCEHKLSYKEKQANEGLSKIASLQEELHQLRKEAQSSSAAQQKLAKLRLTLEDTKSNKQAAETQVSYFSEEVERLKVLLQKKENSLRKATVKITQLELQLTEGPQQPQYAAPQRPSTAGGKTSSEAYNALKVLKEENVHLEQIIVELRKSVSLNDSRLKKEQEDKESLLLRLQIAEEQRSQAATGASEAILERDEAEERRGHLHCKVAELEQQLVEMQGSLERAAASAALKEASNRKKTESVVKELKAKILALEKELEASKEELLLFKKKEQQVPPLLLSACDNGQPTQSEHTRRVQQQLEDATVSSEEKASQTDVQHKKDIEELAHLCEQADATIADCLEQLSSRTERLSHCEAALVATKEQLESKEQECQNLHSAVATLKLELASLNEDAEHRIKVLQEDLRAATFALTEGEEERRNIQTLAARCQIDFNTKVAELELAMKEIRSLQMARELAQAQLEACVGELHAVGRVAADTERARLVAQDAVNHLQAEMNVILEKLRASEEARISQDRLHQDLRRQSLLDKGEKEGLRCQLEDVTQTLRSIEREQSQDVLKRSTSGRQSHAEDDDLEKVKTQLGEETRAREQAEHDFKELLLTIEGSFHEGKDAIVFLRQENSQLKQRLSDKDNGEGCLGAHAATTLQSIALGLQSLAHK